MKRVNVVGSSGSGKTTFGRRLAEALGAPFIEMDALFWRPGWTQTPDEAFFPILRDALRGDTWVVDGNYTRTVPIKWARADTVVWLDYGFARTLVQSVIRATRRAWRKNELWPGTGCRETFKESFLSKDSIILWSVTNFGKNKRKYERYRADPRYAHIRFVRLRSPKEAEAFLAVIAWASLPASANSTGSGAPP